MALLLALTGLHVLVPATKAAETYSPPQRKVLVLADGRVIAGMIAERPGGYLVAQRDSQFAVTYRQVSLIADSLPQAYEKRRDLLKEPNAGDHLALAEWCFKYRLYDACRQQLDAALRLEPERASARELLVRLERTVNPDSPLLDPNTAQPRSMDGLVDGEQTGFGGLPRELAGEFVRKVHPLLVRSCATAGCHLAGSGRKFELQPALLRVGSRRMTEQNLAAVLTQFDPAEPTHSPLLVRPKDATHARVFSGPAGPAQQQTLWEWSIAAAEFATIDSPIPVGTPPKTTNVGTVQQAAFETESDDLLNRVLLEERPDPFDPAEFNRRFHGR